MKKHIKKHIKKLYKFKIFRYIIGWWLAAVIDLLLLYIFTEYFWIHYIISSIISFIFAFCFGFIFQKYITFENKESKYIKHGFLFLFFQLIGIIFNVLLLWILVEWYGYYYIYVAIFNKIIIFVWNFYMNNKFNFK